MRKKENDIQSGFEQEKKSSMISVFLGAFICLVIVFIAMIVMERTLLNKDQEKATVVMTKDVLSGGLIPEGSYIPTSDLSKYFEVCEVDASLVPEGAYESLDEMGDTYVIRELTENIIVVRSWFVSESQTQVVMENPVQVSFTVENLGAAVAGTLRKGDYISIGTIYKNENNEFDVAKIVECVLIDEAFTAEGIVASSLVGNEATMFTVTIPAESVDVFFRSCANGTLVVGKVIVE